MSTPVDEPVEHDKQDKALHCPTCGAPTAQWHAMYDAAKEYYRALQEAKGADEATIEKLAKKLDSLAAPYGDNPAYAAFLAMERLKAGL